MVQIDFNMNRRKFIKRTILTSGSIITALNLKSSPAISYANQEKIITVNGVISPEECGTVLSHEHLFSNFGAEPDVAHQFNEDKLFDQVLPYLQKVKELGCNTIVECTTAYFGRRVDILKQLADKTGLNIITNTGYYGAASDKYVPEHAYTDSVKDIASRWINEFNNGIENISVRPGFIKVAVDKGPLSDIDAKLVRAAAIAHRQTGMVIAVHTGDNIDAANKQLDILKEEGVHPGAWIWTHANKVGNAKPLIHAAQQGGWISLDGIRNQESQRHHLSLINDLRKAKLLDHVLLSHDGNGFPSGKEIRQFHKLFTEFIPFLQKNGYNEQEIKQLIQYNPRRAFKIHVRTT